VNHLARGLMPVSALVLLCACGGGTGHSSQLSSPPSSPLSNPPPQEMNIAGNWQFSATSTVLPGEPPATIAGSIIQSGSTVSGAGHVDGWKLL
jgi:hypothetical protein